MKELNVARCKAKKKHIGKRTKELAKEKTIVQLQLVAFICCVSCGRLLWHKNQLILSLAIR